MSFMMELIKLHAGKIRNDGISPVIGVMLILVVVIVIGAVVALFATGIIGGTEEAPTVVLDVVVDSSWEE